MTFPSDLILQKWLWACKLFSSSCLSVSQQSWVPQSHDDEMCSIPSEESSSSVQPLGIWFISVTWMLKRKVYSIFHLVFTDCGKRNNCVLYFRNGIEAKRSKVSRKGFNFVAFCFAPTRAFDVLRSLLTRNAYCQVYEFFIHLT